MIPLRIRKVGKSLGVTLPAAMTRALHMRERDIVYLTETPGGFQLTFCDPQFAEGMQVAEGFLARYRNALGDLAK